MRPVGRGNEDASQRWIGGQVVVYGATAGMHGPGVSEIRIGRPFDHISGQIGAAFVRLPRNHHLIVRTETGRIPGLNIGLKGDLLAAKTGGQEPQ